MAISKQEQKIFHEDRRVTRAIWAIQRGGWVVMFLFVGAASLGLFGNGPLNFAQARGEGMTIQFHRFELFRTPTRLLVRIDQAALNDNIVKLKLSKELAISRDVLSITPIPESVRSAGDHIEYTFNVDPRHSAEVLFRYEPKSIGSRRTTVKLEGRPAVELFQFVFP